LTLFEFPFIWPDGGWLLLAISFVSSALTAAVGAGGGMLMLASLAALLPSQAIVPVHGMVQLGSNAGRMLMSRQSIQLRSGARILSGGLVGTLAAWPLVDRLPAGALECLIAVFVLSITWLPIPLPDTRQRTMTSGYGVLVGFLNLTVGAVGPLVGAYLRHIIPNRMEVVATMAFCLTALHILKSQIFSLSGFTWTPWLWMIISLIGAGLVGTQVGLGILGKLPEQRFRLLFRIMITLIAIHLFWRGINVIMAR